MMLCWTGWGDWWSGGDVCERGWKWELSGERMQSRSRKPVLRPRDFELWIRMQNWMRSMRVISGIDQIAMHLHTAIDSGTSERVGVSPTPFPRVYCSRWNQTNPKLNVVRLYAWKDPSWHHHRTKTKQEAPPTPLVCTHVERRKKKWSSAHAIKSVVTSSTERVCDIGTGSGLLGILAAKRVQKKSDLRSNRVSQELRDEMRVETIWMRTIQSRYRTLFQIESFPEENVATFSCPKS